MSAGRCALPSELPAGMRELLASARRIVLTTLGPDGMPHAVPACHAMWGEEMVIEVDDKPKSGRELARVRNIRARPEVAVLADRWDEDWTRLAWVMVRGLARIEPPGYGTEALLGKYEQYRQDPPTGPVIAIRARVVSWWSWS